jgi:hypothetical protein
MYVPQVQDYSWFHTCQEEQTTFQVIFGMLLWLPQNLEACACSNELWQQNISPSGKFVPTIFGHRSCTPPQTIISPTQTNYYFNTLP